MKNARKEIKSLSVSDPTAFRAFNLTVEKFKGCTYNENDACIEVCGSIA
jgi:hypothetical protein